MSNSFFDWAASVTRFVRRDTARAEEVNDALDAASLGFEAVEALTNAAIKLSAGETSTALGNAAARKGKVLTFNATTGAAEAVTATTDVATVAAHIANIDTVAGNDANITTVAGISGNVATVSGISANVTDVAGISGSVTTVATNNVAVSTVATGIADVGAVAAGIANVNIVAGISADVSTVSANGANVTTCAANIAAIIAAPTEASNAAASASSAAAIYDAFDDRYLGSKTADPALDNDGNALITGALYWNSVASQMRAYGDAAWQAAYLPSGVYVAGPASVTDGDLAVFDGATGKIVRSGGAPAPSPASSHVMNYNLFGAL